MVDWVNAGAKKNENPRKPRPERFKEVNDRKAPKRFAWDKKKAGKNSRMNSTSGGSSNVLDGDTRPSILSRPVASRPRYRGTVAPGQRRLSADFRTPVCCLFQTCIVIHI